VRDPHLVRRLVELKVRQLGFGPRRHHLDGTDAGSVELSDAIFGLEIPKHVDGVPQAVLDPRATWQDPTAYDAKAQKLAAMFRDNFKQYEEQATPEVRAAGPQV